MTKQTVFALSTSSGKAAIAVVRISGSRSFEVVRELVGSVPPPRTAVLRSLRYKDELVDRALVICFKENASYTGEDMVEFHIHGSMAVIDYLSEVLSVGFNLGVADPGEFTRRALENGCMDLSQVEGLLDLINSETKEQKNQSLKVLSGVIGNKTNGWRTAIINSLALAEVMIDFSEEEVPKNTIGDILMSVKSLIDELGGELKHSNSLELIREGFDVTIVGKPNVGKSSLLNYLAGKEKAIVSEKSGTTRDIIELGIDLKGFRVNLFDTAGIHDSTDEIEIIGIERAKIKASQAHMRVFLLSEDDEVEDFGIIVKKTDIIFCAKSDLGKSSVHPGISSKSGEGVSKMLNKISKNIYKSTSYSGVLINKRHKTVIKSTISLLKRACLELKKPEVQIEIVAEDLRLAIMELDFLVGKINVEDVLGDIFSSFCIGK